MVDPEFSEPTEENENLIDIFDDDEKDQFWEGFVKDRNRFMRQQADESRLREQSAEKKKQKRLNADASKKRNRR